MIAYHSNKVAPRTTSSQSSRHKCITDRYIEEQAASIVLGVDILEAIYDMIMFKVSSCIRSKGVSFGRNDT